MTSWKPKIWVNNKTKNDRDDKVEISSQSFVVLLLTQILDFQDVIVFRDLFWVFLFVFFLLYYTKLHTSQFQNDL